MIYLGAAYEVSTHRIITAINTSIEGRGGKPVKKWWRSGEVLEMLVREHGAQRMLQALYWLLSASICHSARRLKQKLIL
jgi:hypothetical protein